MNAREEHDFLNNICQFILQYLQAGHRVVPKSVKKQQSPYVRVFVFVVLS
jgi:hypothetical protein